MQDGLECLVCTFVNPEGSTRCQMCTIEIGTRLEGRVPLERGTKIFAQESVQRDLSRRGGRDENVVLREVKILDQFGPDFKGSIKKYSTPGAICGYTSTAAAHFILSQQNDLRANGQALDLYAFQRIIYQLNDADIFVREVEVMMKAINEDRRKYIDNFGAEFKTQRDKEGYITDWVANYEISDLLLRAPIEIRQRLHFVRHIERGNVKHEEARRLVEEKPFLGVEFFMESFVSEEEANPEKEGSRACGERILLNPFEWKTFFANRLQATLGLEDSHQGSLTRIPEDVFIVDLQGHFGVAKPMVLNGVPTLVLINTTQFDYLDRPILDKFVKLWFWSSDVDDQSFLYK